MPTGQIYPSSSFKPINKRQEFEILRNQLEIERSSFLTHWRDLGDFILPRRPRFEVTEVNRGERKNQKIIDSTATLALRTLRSGMMGGVTSPARPWFNLTTIDPDLADFAPIKEWLYTVTQRMRSIFLRSNLYNVLPIVYGDLGCFATSAMSVEEDFGSVIRCYPFPIGSYSIANDDKLRVRVFFREFRYTVRQVVMKFGQTDPKTGAVDWSNISTHVKNMWDNGNYEIWVDVVHVIQPNPNFDGNRMGSKFKKFLSVYYERGLSGQNSKQNYITPGTDEGKFLSESGYDFFPILAPRWEVNAEDVYGTDCPGMTALGDIRQLQLGEKRAAQAIEKMIKPPMTGPTAMRNQSASILPGDITYVDTREGHPGFRPAHEVRDPHIRELEGKQDQVRGRIRRAFYEDLFLMLALDPRSEPPTAREVEERHEEKLLALGPVLEQLNQDLLDPLIDNTFDFMVRQSVDARGNFIDGAIIPRPPEELRGAPLKVEYVSIMAQAQKMLGITSVDRFTNFAINTAAQTQKLDLLDVVDFDELVRTYGDITSIPPKILKRADVVAAERQQKAQQAQAMQATQMVREGAGAAKDLASADLEGNNALKELMRQAQAGQVT